MTERPTPSFERHCDVAIVGGSAAGLAAALQLGRQRRSTIVIDAGEPRNAPAAHMHSYLGHEGLPPSELATIARAEVRSYGSEILSGIAASVTHDAEGRFRIELVGGNAVVARRVIMATGIVDQLPDIDGLAELWGTDVIHCPFCHGYEVRDQRIVQILTHPIGLHPARLFHHLSERFTIVLHGDVPADADELRPFVDAGVPVVPIPARRLLVDDNGALSGVELDDGARVPADAIAVANPFHLRAEPFADLGVATSPHPTGLGDVITTDQTGQTSVRGVYAAGNVTDPSQQVLQAAADGSRIAGAICVDLATEDLAASVRFASNQADWEHRYSADRVWSGNPNGALVHEVTDLEPGRALDVGAGEGGDAIWLAEQGWSVTAMDVAQRAVDQIDELARHQGLPIEPLHADVNGRDPFDDAQFDLVTAHYASIPRSPDDRAIDNLLAAVAHNGILLVVAHDPEPMRKTWTPGQPSRMFDPDAYVGVDDFAAALAGDPAWEIEHHEKRPRPPGSATAAHHVDDIVLRARRIGAPPVAA